MQALAAETGLTITNPLVLYRALVATKRIEPDPAQHRLALHLQKLYHRLKDYEPAVEYRVQLEQVTRALGEPNASGSEPLARRRLSGVLNGFRGSRAETDSLALTRRLTDYEAALHLDSPQGLLLYGEVGTGKSMLIDLLADSLPNRKKRRYHFNAFMLDTFARIEKQRIAHAMVRAGSHQHEHALIAMARDLISTSPILFLDEFQLPDRASSKILSNLFTSFFQLGGVLVATSNRMPEELSKAAGVEFEAPSSPTARLGFPGLRNFFRGSEGDLQRGVNSRKNDFTQFVDVLKARCETWNMESKTDFRRRDAGINFRAASRAGENLADTLSLDQGSGAEGDVAARDSVDHPASAGAMPTYYFQASADMLSPDSLRDESLWQASVLRAAAPDEATISNVAWSSEVLSVYGRRVPVPKACNGTSMWTFDELCNTYLGPADYISLASKFHTLILIDVPELTSVRRNEARRFITLLDALYESRCRLLIRAELGPDELFFRDARQRSSKSSVTGSSKQEQEGDSVYAETLSEIYQDATSPFRPNVSAYGATTEAESMPKHAIEPHRNTRSILADEDADFGPVYGAGRSAGASVYDHSGLSGPGFSSQQGPNFQRTQSFTGQDERFAYKRAESRLWELCSQRWWEKFEQGDWWKPVSQEARAWEATRSHLVGDVEGADSLTTPGGSSNGSGSRSIQDKNVQEVYRPGVSSPFRVLDEPPPTLSWTHVWGLMQWGRKAGTWGKGTDGVEERLRQKQQEKEILQRIQPKPRTHKTQT